MKAESDDRSSLVLLLLLLFFLVLSAFLPEEPISEVVLVLSSYAILIVAILKVSDREVMPWPALLLTATSLVVTVVCVLHPVRPLRVANWLLLSAFFGYVSVALFSFLERSGPIIRAKLMACLGLYLILGMLFYAVYNLLQEIHPASFVEGGSMQTTASRHSLLYFSLTTLTTLGIGDVVPVTRPARMIAALEAVTGVFYVAITVARLIAAYQMKDRGES